MGRRVVDLHLLPWELGRVPRQPLGRAMFPDDYVPVDDRAAVEEWLPVLVPGDIRSHLIALNRIPDVDTPEGIEAGQWVDDCDWWYRVRLPRADPADQVILEADGIDYYSATWLDRQMLGTHSGMFGRQHICLSPWINQGSEHELAIRVWGGGALPGAPNSPSQRALRWLIARLNPGMEYYPDRMATPKAQYSFGWDFAPRVLTAGIWDDIRLVTARGAYILDCWPRAEPLTATDDPTPATWSVGLRITRWRARAVTIEISIEPEDSIAAGYQSVTRSMALCAVGPGPCTEYYEFPIEMASVHRWWPWDQGNPNLYRVTVRMRDHEGVLDESSQLVGLRSIERGESDGNGRWALRVNGRPVFLRGANWVPADVLPGRLDDARYEPLLAMAKAAGVNFLRLWGGGIREKRAFWEILDREGILAWQEFPLACAFLDHYPRDRYYRQALMSEAEGMVRTLRVHPSLIAWCGGNEINPTREESLLVGLRDIVRRADPDRLWLEASPANGDIHFWDTWHGFAPWSVLETVRSPFMSEFGFQALPDATTVSEMFPAGIPPLSSARWQARKAQVKKLVFYAGTTLIHSGRELSGQELRDSIAATQRVQSAALQLGLETCRLRRDAGGIAPDSTCGGVAFWQLNEPWKAVSWSVIDRTGRPKAAYDMLVHSYQPLLIAARFHRRRWQAGELFCCAVWIVNDGREAWEGAIASAKLDGVQVWECDRVSVLPSSARIVGEFAQTLAARPEQLGLELRHAGQPLAANRYDLGVHLSDRQPLRARLNRWLADRLLGAR